MTHRPADIAPGLWADLYAGKAERLERAWLRLYCACIPKPYRRRLFWSAGLGPLAIVLWTGWAALLLLPPFRHPEDGSAS